MSRVDETHVEEYVLGQKKNTEVLKTVKSRILKWNIGGGSTVLYIGTNIFST